MRAVVGLIALLLSACGGSGGPHSVLLITLDTTRADALGAYGNAHSVTPNLDKLAAEGVVCEHAFTVAPLTLPAHSSILTGLFPPRHGVRDNGIAALPQAATTLAERAHAAGFQTAAILGSAVLDAGFGLEQGFDRYEAPARHFYNNPKMGYAERPAAEVATLAAEWLAGGPRVVDPGGASSAGTGTANDSSEKAPAGRDPERPFFLWLHLWDAHAPYEPAPEMLARAGGNAYLGEVASDDLAVGRVLAALRKEKLFDSTLIVVVADHGEAFAEHGEFSHGPFVWNTTLQVPLILHLPGARRAGERVAELASVVDVYPTALAAMGIRLDEKEERALDGVNLLRKAPPANRGAYLESYYGYFNFGWHPLAGWITRAGKYVHGKSARFYDCEKDPGEEHDVLAAHAAEVTAARGSLLEIASGSVLARDAEGLDPDYRRELQALGYAAMADEGTSVPAPNAELALPDPLACVAELQRFQQAEGELAADKFEAAERDLGALVKARPENPFAWDRLALCLIRMNRHKEAIAPLERVIGQHRGNADTWTYLAACELVAGDEKRALEAFTHALALDPNHVQALGGLVHVMESAGLAARAAPFKQRFDAVQARP